MGCEKRSKDEMIYQVVLGFDTLEIKRVGKDDVALDAHNSCCKLALQLGVPDTLRRCRHLAQQLLQTLERTNDRSLKHVGHLADL